MRFSVFKSIIPFIASCLISATHIGPAYSTKPYYVLDTLGKKIAKEYQLEFLNSGLGSLADAEQGLWALNLVSRQEMTLEQGRELATAIANKLLDKMFTDPSFVTYCEKQDKTLKKEYAAFRLAFWDKNTNRPRYPFIAQIRLADGNLYYHYADLETQALQEPIVESFNQN